MYYFIINPTSSSGRCLKAWNKVKGYLDLNKVEYEEHILTGPGDASAIAARLSSVSPLSSLVERENHLVVIGGDGTLSEVLSGIDDFRLLKLSVIRAGSGNDFARNMKIGKNVIRTLRHILYSPEESALDYGVIKWNDSLGEHSRRFAISCGIGYDADICREVSVSRLKAILNKLGLGKLVYLAIGLRQIFFRRFNRAVLTADDRQFEMEKFFLAASMIHETEGGGVPFCPGSDPTDGILNGCFIGHLSKLQLLPAVMLVYLRRHMTLSGITLHTYRTLSVSLDTPEYIHADGDVICRSDNAKISIKNGLRFIR